MADNDEGLQVAETAGEAEHLDLGSDQPGDTSPSIEEKYRLQMRQIMPQKIELPITTLPAMIEEQINLNPEFQRRDRWDQARQSRFIESIIMNVPIPPVFLGEDEYGMYVVLDGRQRLTAVNEFLKNSYELKGLEVWNELNGKRFNDLKKQKLDRFLTRRFIPAVVILKESSPEVKYDVFDRLNTGAVIAEPMEIRNAVFKGTFNDLLRTLSSDLTFRQLWDIPTDNLQREKNQNYLKMVDLELVLRFFALRDYERMNSRFKDYLSVYMGERNGLYKQHPELLAEDEKQFLTAVKNCWRVFGENAFRKPTTGNRSAPMADAYMVALSTVDPKDLADDKAALKVGTALTHLLHHVGGSCSFPAGCNFENGLVTRFLSA
jgi:Protein of unknown function DUF262